jgi:hypothetical protein
MISTRALSELPDIEPLRRLMRSLAMLDAVLMPEWQYRYFSFNRRWAPGEEMGSMRDGSGDHYFALFNAAGCWLKGFAHESPMSPWSTTTPRITAGVLDGVPPEFAACLAEPAFVIDETTFCVWRRHADAAWQRGTVQWPGLGDVDGSAGLLRWLDGRAETYRAWAEDYYQRPVSLKPVEALYAHRPLDEMLVKSLNDEVALSDLRADIDEIGYPVAQ